jgi:hypothetical protein
MDVTDRRRNASRFSLLILRSTGLDRGLGQSILFFVSLSGVLRFASDADQCCASIESLLASI